MDFGRYLLSASSNLSAARLNLPPLLSSSAVDSASMLSRYVSRSTRERNEYLRIVCAGTSYSQYDLHVQGWVPKKRLTQCTRREQ